MKRLKTFTVLIILSCSLFFVNCTPSQDFLPTNREVITNGKWQVEYFSAGADLTADFNSIELAFNNDGTISNNKNNQSINGRWNISNEEILQIIINTQDELLLKLNNDWKIADQSSLTMSLEKREPHFTQMRIRKI